MSESERQRKLRRPRLMALLGVPGVVLLLLAGAVAWSWDHPVILNLGHGSLRFGRTPAHQDFQIPLGWQTQGTNRVSFAWNVPGDSPTVWAFYQSPYVIVWDQTYRIAW